MMPSRRDCLKLLAVTPIGLTAIGTLIPPTLGANEVDLDAADHGPDETEVVQRMLDSATSVNLPARPIRITRPLRLRPRQQLTSNGGRIILDMDAAPSVGLVTADHVRIAGLSFAAGPRFLGQAIVVPGASPNVGGGTKSVSIRGCSFEFANDDAIGVKAEQGVNRVVVRSCSQSRGQFLFFGIGTRESEILDCRTESVVRAITFYGGRGNIIARNHVIGGVTGILFLSLRRQGPAGNLIVDNQIIDNILEGQSEESIGFDCRCNGSAQWAENPTAPIVTVRSSSDKGDVSTLVKISEVAGKRGWANRFWVVAIDSDDGAVGEVLDSTSDTLAIQWTGIGGVVTLKAGNRLALTSGSFRNLVARNRVRDPGICGISLWGSNWHMTVEANDIIANARSGICLKSVVAPKITQAQSLSGWNRISDNRIEMVAGPHGKDDAFPIFVGSRRYGGQLLDFNTFHNRVTNNQVLSSAPCRVEDAAFTIIESSRATDLCSWEVRDTTSTTIRGEGSGGSPVRVRLYGKNPGLDR